MTISKRSNFFKAARKPLKTSWKLVFPRGTATLSCLMSWGFCPVSNKTLACVSTTHAVASGWVSGASKRSLQISSGKQLPAKEETASRLERNCKAFLLVGEDQKTTREIEGSKWHERTFRHGERTRQWTDTHLFENNLPIEVSRKPSQRTVRPTETAGAHVFHGSHLRQCTSPVSATHRYQLGTAGCESRETWHLISSSDVLHFVPQE